MDKRLAEMLDHYEITKLLNEYCHGLDRMDEVKMASVYAKDSWDDHGPNKCSGPEFAHRVMQLMKARVSIASSHFLGQTLIHVDGDQAGAVTYFVATNRSPAEGGRENLNHMGGRYVDELVREDGRWKIKHRTCVRDWSITLPIEHDWLAGGDYIQPSRSNQDPSFAALRMTHSGVPGDD